MAEISCWWANRVDAYGEPPYMSSLVWSMTNEDASRLMNADDSHFAMALDDATGLAFGRITDIGERQAFPVIPTHAVWPVAGRLDSYW